MINDIISIPAPTFIIQYLIDESRKKGHRISESDILFLGERFLHGSPPGFEKCYAAHCKHCAQTIQALACRDGTFQHGDWPICTKVWAMF